MSALRGGRYGALVPFGRPITYEPGLRVEGASAPAAYLAHGPCSWRACRGCRMSLRARLVHVAEAQVQVARADSRGVRLGPLVPLSTGGGGRP